jgi:uncharacterized protein (DUF1800 family)
VGIYTNDTVRQNVAVDLHWREHNKIRQALLDPNCTFYDLLKISVESPAMIIYLDTILNSKAAPNQNYAREILELHSMGADNGYIQQDIVDLAKVWTGWRVDKKDAAVADNPFATPISRANLTNFANTPGLWVLHYNTNQHDTGTKRPVHERADRCAIRRALPRWAIVFAHSQQHACDWHEWVRRGLIASRSTSRIFPTRWSS